MVEENTYIISNAMGQAIIIDCGALYPEEQAALHTYIDQKGLHPILALNTHAHFDHIFGAQWVKDTYGLSPQFHPADLPLYEHSDEAVQQFFRRKFDFPHPLAGHPLSDGQNISFGQHQLTVIHTPGHTPGGVCFYCEAEKILFSGDTLFLNSIGRCDLPGGNLQQLVMAIRTRLLPLPDDVTVLPGHGPSTTIGHERRHNPYLQ